MQVSYPIPEAKHVINGVEGHLFAIQEPQTVRGRLVHRGQKWLSVGRPVAGYGAGGVLSVNIRFDDQCQNGHQTFAITADIYTDASRRRSDAAACGCLHDEIAKVFPELAPLIKWHGVSTDSPIHYAANTVYHASNLDHRGYAKGEACAWKTVLYFGDSPVSHPIKESFAKWLQSRMQLQASGHHRLFGGGDMGEFTVVAIAHKDTPGEAYKFQPKYTFAGYRDTANDWAYCPFDDQQTAQEWADALNTLRCKFSNVPTAFSEGKERNFEFARDSACWPEATDAQLSLPKDELLELLNARLPALVADFRKDMDAIGLLWEPEQPATV